MGFRAAPLGAIIVAASAGAQTVPVTVAATSPSGGVPGCTPITVPTLNGGSVTICIGGDTVSGGTSNTPVTGDPVNNVPIFTPGGGSGGIIVIGGGNDTVVAGTGNNTVFAGSGGNGAIGTDTVLAGAGNNVWPGSGGDGGGGFGPIITAGSGSNGGNTLPSGSASDVLSPGSGSAEPIGSPAPEPDSWVMMVAGFGLAGTALRGRRRRTAEQG